MAERRTAMPDVYTHNVATSPEEAARIIPRAEFRVFGQGVIDGVSKKMWDVAAVLQKARKMPPETYFLSTKTNEANVKVRDGLLDIKIKVGETPEGYEIFQPRGKFQFPVKREDLKTILEHLKVDMGQVQETVTIEEFIGMARKHPDLFPVSVEKMRYGFSIGAVICEYAQVWFNGAMVESACCESEDSTALRQVAEALGIAAMPNTNYLRAAKQVIGLE
jgi:hypothetical protein